MAGSTFAMISTHCVAGRDRGKGLPVLSARQFIGAATTALSLITGVFLLALAAGNARAQGSAPACDAAGEIALLPSPWAPWRGAPLRVMLVTEKPLQGELSLTGPDGSVAATSRENSAIFFLPPTPGTKPAARDHRAPKKAGRSSAQAKRQAECVLRRGDAVVAVFQPYDREGFGAGCTLAKCADTVNFCE